MDDSESSSSISSSGFNYQRGPGDDYNAIYDWEANCEGISAAHVLHVDEETGALTFELERGLGHLTTAYG